MTRKTAALSLLLHRLTRRFEFKVSVTVALAFTFVAFAETCLHFYGADVGDLPSPAYAWAWNMDAMQSNAMRVFLYFFMPVVAALVFAGCARDEIDRGMASCVAARSSLRSYLASHMVLTYLGAFFWCSPCCSPCSFWRASPFRSTGHTAGISTRHCMSRRIRPTGCSTTCA